jgi:hypothetical protein
MKSIFFASAFLVCLNVRAATLASTIESKFSVARIAKVITLVDKSDIKVNLVGEDLGGSTDFSPNQRAWFTLYSKVEMYSTEASFVIAEVFAVTGARRVSGGVYEVTASVPSAETAMPTPAKLRIDAVAAITKLKAVACEDFDFEASANFSAEIDVAKK